MHDCWGILTSHAHVLLLCYHNLFTKIIPITTYCAHSFSYYTVTNFSVYRKDLQIFYIASKQRRQTFLLQHFSSSTDMPDLHYFIPDYDYSIFKPSKTFLRRQATYTIPLKIDTIKNFSSDTYYIYFSIFTRNLRRHLCTIDYTGLRHYTLFPFARPNT
jgi:hypothetical protein